VQQQQTARWLAAVAELEASRLVVGIDLQHRRRTDRQVVLETGTHSRWVAQLLELMGQEVIVANARKLKMISENNQKSDRVDARLLSELGCTNVEWLHGIYLRSDAWPRDL
jgi:transposase